MVDPFLSLTASWCLSALFLAAGVHKMLALDQFGSTLASYGLLPASVTPLITKIIPFAELTTGAALLLPESQSISGIAAFCLLSLYSLSIAINLLRGRTAFDCGCSFGSHVMTLSRWHLLRNGLLMGISLTLVLPSTDRMLNWIDFSSAIAAVIVFAFFYLVAEALIFNHHTIASESN